MAILTLPPELIEQIIVLLALSSGPASLAALVLTCKSLHSLLFNPIDSHLWRRIFLSTFDDPRAAQKQLDRLHDLPTQTRDIEFDWQGDYKKRMRTAGVIRRSHQVIPDSQGHLKLRYLQTPDEMTASLESLQAVLTTTLPFPTSDLLLVTSQASGSDKPSHKGGITFSPLVLLICHYNSNSISPETIHHIRRLECASTGWLEDLLKHGYPPILTKHLLDKPEVMQRLVPDGVELEKRYPRSWEKTENATAFFKLVAGTGFIPSVLLSRPGTTSSSTAESDAEASSLLISPTVKVQEEQSQYFHPKSMSFGPSSIHEGASPRPPSPSASVLEKHSEAAEEDSPKSEPPLRDPVALATDIGLSPDAQFASARRKARQIVYDMSYLKLSRRYGPFLPTGKGAEAAEDEWPGRHLGGLGLLSAQLDDEDEDDPDDPDFVENGTSHSDSTTSTSDSEDEDNTPITLFDFLATGMGPETHVPTASELEDLGPESDMRADWRWIASARIVVEANLRDMLSRPSLDDPFANLDSDEVGGDPNLLMELGKALRKIDGLRMGAAPGFWNGWTARTSASVGASNEGESAGGFPVNIIDGKGKGKSKETEDGLSEEGWDWAGVEGNWRRCICWLDYRDLMVNNTMNPTRRFQEPGLQEALRIIPMTLRVKGYSWPDSPSNDASTSTPKLPHIHIEGETGGLQGEIIRQISGEVSMIAEGTIRWTMSSNRVGEAAEWVTEGVQVGQPGSAMGIIGMWTGAEHERGDPLGPFWAWHI